jgi:hypothetical protein
MRPLAIEELDGAPNICRRLGDSVGPLEDFGQRQPDSGVVCEEVGLLGNSLESDR